MKINGWLLGIMVALFCALAGYGQTPPPNDNFSNRTVLTGNDLTFSGTLAGATIENSQETAAYQHLLGGTPNQSVWWSWTAPVSTVLTLEVLSSTLDYSQSRSIANSLPVSRRLRRQRPAIRGAPCRCWGFRSIDFRFAPQTLSIAGNGRHGIPDSTDRDQFRRLCLQADRDEHARHRPATPQPHGLFQCHRAVLCGRRGNNQPAFGLSVVLQRNPIPGETAPMLAISNIDSTMAAAYSVIVSNSAGATISAPAMLSVSQSNVPVSLAVTG